MANIEETGEFVVNLVNKDIAESMNKMAAEHPTEVNEFEVSGLMPVTSELIAPPRVSEYL